MSKKNTMFDNLLQDLERTRRRQKICKKNLNENINQVIGALQSGVANIQNNNVMEEVNLEFDLSHFQRKTQNRFRKTLASFPTPFW